MKNTKMPTIRFKGFNDDWEQRKLPEFVTFFNGLTYTPDDVEETGTLVLRSSNVKNGEIVDADNVYVNDKVVTSENVQEGDIIVVVRNGSRALIGKHAQIKASMPNTVIGAFMSGMRSEHSSFVNALLDTSAFENEIAKNMGATINQITGYMFSKMEFMIPSGEEQQKIGEYFQGLDHLITLHQRKLEKIKLMKKSMLGKMFSRDAESIPKIRFDGYTDDWEQRKLEEVCSEIGDGLHSAPEYDDNGKSFFINGNNLINGHIVINSNETKRVSENTFEKNNKQLDDNTVLLSINGTIGNLAYYQGEPVMLGKSAAYLKANKIDKTFLYSLLQTTAVMNNFMLSLTGTTIKNLGLDAIKKTKISIPKLREQERIGLYFSQLDHLITLHQRKLEKLKKVKKSLLEHMFPMEK